jgi:hypothetical protein
VAVSQGASGLSTPIQKISMFASRWTSCSPSR